MGSSRRSREKSRRDLGFSPGQIEVCQDATYVHDKRIPISIVRGLIDPDAQWGWEVVARRTEQVYADLIDGASKWIAPGVFLWWDHDIMMVGGIEATGDLRSLAELIAREIIS